MPERRGQFPWRVQGPIYGTAFFTGNLFPMSHVVMPLWALELGASPLLIGIIISSRQILPVTLSIHGGALLDRFGARNVIMVLGVVGAGGIGNMMRQHMLQGEYQRFFAVLLLILAVVLLLDELSSRLRRRFQDERIKPPKRRWRLKRTHTP